MGHFCWNVRQDFITQMGCKLMLQMARLMVYHIEFLKLTLSGVQGEDQAGEMPAGAAQKHPCSVGGKLLQRVRIQPDGALSECTSTALRPPPAAVTAKYALLLLTLSRAGAN